MKTRLQRKKEELRVYKLGNHHFSEEEAIEHVGHLHSYNVWQESVGLLLNHNIPGTLYPMFYGYTDQKTQKSFIIVHGYSHLLDEIYKQWILPCSAWIYLGDSSAYIGEPASKDEIDAKLRNLYNKAKILYRFLLVSGKLMETKNSLESFEVDGDYKCCSCKKMIRPMCTLNKWCNDDHMVWSNGMLLITDQTYTNIMLELLDALPLQTKYMFQTLSIVDFLDKVSMVMKYY